MARVRVNVAVRPELRGIELCAGSGQHGEAVRMALCSLNEQTAAFDAVRP